MYEPQDKRLQFHAIHVIYIVICCSGMSGKFTASKMKRLQKMSKLIHEVGNNGTCIYWMCMILIDVTAIHVIFNTFYPHCRAQLQQFGQWYWRKLKLTQMEIHLRFSWNNCWHTSFRVMNFLQISKTANGFFNMEYLLQHWSLYLQANIRPFSLVFLGQYQQRLLKTKLFVQITFVRRYDFEHGINLSVYYLKRPFSNTQVTNLLSDLLDEAVADDHLVHDVTISLEDMCLPITVDSYSSKLVSTVHFVIMVTVSFTYLIFLFLNAALACQAIFLDSIGTPTEARRKQLTENYFIHSRLSSEKHVL